jgi:hypothetical protein
MRLMTAGLIPAELMPLINQMTNWQRNQWAKAGYPPDPIRIQFFLGLRRDQLAN